tara:strand:- start:57 stop:284 length:228 start_codon:yes stop_codon:yes gene_type:complete
VTAAHWVSSARRASIAAGPKKNGTSAIKASRISQPVGATEKGSIARRFEADFAQTQRGCSIKWAFKRTDTVAQAS